eukprot:jgi/Hompol1/5254/HPOL_004280-RA
MEMEMQMEMEMEMEIDATIDIDRNSKTDSDMNKNKSSSNSSSNNSSKKMKTVTVTNMKSMASTKSMTMTSERTAPALSLDSVRTSKPHRHPQQRLFGLSAAPEFHPTHEEFADPLAYIASIRPVAEAAGICKIVPPDGWKPPFALDSTKFWFTTRLQEINSIESRSRTTLNYLDQLQKFHQQQGSAFSKIPELSGRPIDLYKLKKDVTLRGGHEKVRRCCCCFSAAAKHSGAQMPL